MLVAEQLDFLAHQGCTIPGCNHKHLSEILFAPKCHSTAGCHLSYPQADMLRLNCAQCKDKILEIAAATTSILRPTCHPDAPVEVAYKSGRAKLKVICRKCRKPVTTIRVLKEG